jgi:deoxycytidine triphosphate deaminase
MTDILEGAQAAMLLSNMVYEKKQVHERSVDLTAKSISRVATTGSIDFGGSEYAPGEKVSLAPSKLDPSDEYGWWYLSAGEFLVEYNEKLSLPSDHLAILQPHERLIECGTTHGTRLITESEEKLFSLIHVCQADVHIKENARISKLIVMHRAE